MDMANFVAIDFETANEDKTSACAIGIVKVEKFQITDTFYTLIRPPDLFFHSLNVDIHGINKEAVLKKPEFNELWEDILPFIEDHTLVAHNAPFDISVLDASLNYYGIKSPQFRSFCTLSIARKVWPRLPSYTLPFLADKLEIPLKGHHHHASFDAYACAQIAIKACEKLEMDSLEELAGRLRITQCRFDRYNQATLPKTPCFQNQHEAIMLLAKGSQGNKYEVWFRKHDGVLSISCTCEAGKWNRMCKHKLGLIKGDTEYLFDMKQQSELKQAVQWVRLTDIQDLLGELDILELKLSDIQDDIKKCKGKINDTLKGTKIAK